MAADHPRIRGEHSIVSGATCTMSGSSPHTRGALAAHLLHGGEAGIIPAYAGSTTPTSTLPKGPGDHPRIRGEHSTVPIALIATAGSSPHTRGAQADNIGATAKQRIIPAYAGSTTRSASEGGSV